MLPGAIDFLVVLAVLYLAECLRLVHPGDVVLDATFGGRTVQRRAVFFPSERWGWLALNPLAPNGPVYGLRPAPGLDRARFDRKALRRRIEQVESAASWTGILSTLQMTLAFLVLPMWAFFLGISTAILWLVIPVLAISAVSAALYLRATRRLGLALPKLDLYGNAVKLLLYPVSVFRARDLLTYAALEAFDPIAVLLETIGKSAAANLAANEYLRLKFLLAGDDPEYAQSRTKLLEWFDERERLSLRSLTAAPPPIDATSRTYCPRCSMQYRLESGTCSDCPGIALQPLSTPRA